MSISLEPISVLGGLQAIEAANTAAATGAWIDVRQVIGDIRVVVNVGTVAAGTITPDVEDADDISGTNNASVTPREGAFTAIGTTGDETTVVRHIKANSIRGFIRFVGTVVTGPAAIAVDFEGRLKYS